MLELGADNVVGWLRDRGHLPAGCPAQAEVLSGGVSNVVLRIRPEDGPDFVVKQSRERLRTEAAWFSRLDRIWREADVMRDLEPLTPPGFVPRVLFEDRGSYAFGMQAVPAAHTVWKSELLGGDFDGCIAARLGAVTRQIHQSTAGAEAASFRGKYGDREVFEQLRIDPFYRRVAAAHPDLNARISELIEQTLATSDCLVHGDLSPKNLLVTRGGAAGGPDPDELPHLTLVDYEVAHYGDPAFDIGFLLSHLLLKAVYHASRGGEVIGLARTFREAYGGRTEAGGLAAEPEPATEVQELEGRAVPHVAACLLARIDGTSRIDYLPEPERQEFVRSFARRILLEGPRSLTSVFETLERALRPTDTK